MNNLYLLILYFVLLSFDSFSYGGPDWELESDINGIQIYTKDVEGAKYKQVKGVTNLTVPIEHLIQILTDFNGYHQWIKHISESYVMNATNDTTFYVYTMEDAPWPVQNRYHVSKMTVSKAESHCTIDFESVPDYVDKRDDAIEMKRQRGSWKLTSLPDGNSQVEFFIDKNPGGYVPAWLVNYLIIETPLKTLQNLKEALDRYPRP